MPSYDIVCPAAGAITAVGTAELETDKAHVFSFANNADMTFLGTIALSAVKGAFTVSGSNTSDELFQASLSDPESLYGPLKASILAALSNANGLTNANGVSAAPANSILKTYLINVAQNSLDSSLDADGIAASLSAAQVKSVAIEDEAFAAAVETGANALVDAVTAGQAATIALQLPHARWLDGSGDSVQASQIPFAANDTILFRFYISQTFTVTNDPEVVDGAAVVAAQAGAGANNAGQTNAANTTDGTAPPAGTGYSVSAKTCDFKLTLTA